MGLGMTSKQILECAVERICDGDHELVRGYRRDRMRYTIDDMIFINDALYGNKAVKIGFTSWDIDMESEV